MMRFIWGVLFFFMLSNTVYAISPITSDVCKAAQNYGKIYAHSQVDDFLRPWTSYEEKAEMLNETSEHAYLYTPFLLIATDAREKSLKGQKIEMADSEKILSDYAGMLSFSVVLFGAEPHFGQNAKVVLTQDNKIIETYQVVIPVKAEKISKHSAQPIFRLQCYFYFLENKVIRDKPMLLSIVTDNGKAHQFYFTSPNIK